MVISEFIEALQAILKTDGDLPVKRYNPALDIMNHPGPSVREIREMRPRESKLKYKGPGDTDEVQQKVCHL